MGEPTAGVENRPGGDRDSTRQPRARSGQSNIAPFRYFVAVGIALSLVGSLFLFLWFCLWGQEPTALFEFPLDDCWIHQVYMRGLWREGFPSYNPGVPEAGFTSPLWLLAGLPFHGLSEGFHLSPVILAKVASALFGAATALGLCLLVRRMGTGPRISLLAIPVLLLNPGFAFSSVSGCEVTLTAALLMYALLAHHGGRFLWAGILLGLAGLARPESALMVGVVAAFALIEPGACGHRIGRLVRLVVPPLVMGSLWVGYNLAVTGFPLPNTYYVKGGAGAVLSQRLGYYLQVVLLDPGLPLVAITAILLVLGVTTALSRSPNRRTIFVILLGQILTLAAMVLVHPIQPQVRFYLQRYFYPFTALDGVAVMLGLAAIWAHIGRKGRPVARPAIRFALLAALLVLPLPGLLAAREEYAAHCRDIEVLHTRPALWIEAHTPADAVLAVEGAGSARFHSNRFTLDLLGLNYHPLAHTGSDNTLRTCLILGHRPSFFLVPLDWLPQISHAFDLWVLQEFGVERWSAVGGREGRTVVVAHAQARAGTYERCRRLYGSSAGIPAREPRLEEGDDGQDVVPVEHAVGGHPQVGDGEHELLDED